MIDFLLAYSMTLIATVEVLRVQTCSELEIANMYWKAKRSLLTENTPNSQVMPRIGQTTAKFHMAALQKIHHLLGLHTTKIFHKKTVQTNQ